MTKIKLENTNITVVATALAKQLSKLWKPTAYTSSHALFTTAATSFLRHVKDFYGSSKVNSLPTYTMKLSLTNCLNIIADALIYLKVTPSNTSSKGESELISLRSYFLKILTEQQVHNKSSSCDESDNHCIGIVRVNSNTSTVEVENNNGAGAVIENNKNDGYLTVSTFHVNIFKESLKQVKGEDIFNTGGVDLPVVGISLLSETDGNKFPLNSIVNFKVVIPLVNSTKETTDALFPLNPITIYLPTPCENKRKQTVSSSNSRIDSKLVNNICGPLKVNFNISILKEALNFGKKDSKNTDKTIGHIILLPIRKCRFLKSPCFSVTFVDMSYQKYCDEEEKSCVESYSVVKKVFLPKAAKREKFNDDTFSIELTRNLLRKLNINNLSLTVLIEDLQIDPLHSIREGEDTFRKVLIRLNLDLKKKF